VQNYEQVRLAAKKPDLNESMLQRARRTIEVAHATIFEGAALLMSSLPNGLGKKRKYVVLVNQFQDLKLAEDVVLKPIWNMAVEFSGAAPAARSAASDASPSAAATGSAIVST
jgi:hypothetical protein